MATLTTMMAVAKTKQALDQIKAFEPVVQRLKDNAFNEATGEAQATVSLSIGMMKYMGTRLQGLDQGRKADDALRQELNKRRKSLAEMKARKSSENETHSQVTQGDGKNNQDQAPRDKSIFKTSKSSSAEQRSPTGQVDGKDEGSRNGALCGSKQRNADSSKRRSKKLKSK